MALKRGVLVLLGALGSACMLALLMISVSAQASVPTETQPLQLPVAVDGTDLLAVELVRYDGPFIEDGTGTEVISAAALLLRNLGDSGITRGSVVLEQGSRHLTFLLTHLPPGGTVLVTEWNGQLFSGEPVTACYGWTERDPVGWNIGEVCSIEPADMGSVYVTNQCAQPLNRLRLCYKTFYPEAGFYLGGITYEVYIHRLEPGERLQIWPSRYAMGYTAFVRFLQEKETPSQNQRF